MTGSFRIGIAGLGTVGVGVVRIVQDNAALLADRAGRAIEIVAVSSRDKSKDRGIDCSTYQWVDSAQDLAGMDLDVVVELIGGPEGLAHDLVTASLKNKKHVVTANKALLAHHGYALAGLAEQHNVTFSYEAAVAGGIPIIKAIREGLAANEIQSVCGILNGTCNYILSNMRETGRDFADVLQEAQDLGYAEADPAFDVGGTDTAHKLAILASLAFGIKPSFDHVHLRGIRALTSVDITFATELGYRIKLLGMAQQIDGQILQIVAPCLVPVDSALGGVEDVLNAVQVKGDFVDAPVFIGRGAGQEPTASAVVADIVDLARGIQIPSLAIPANKLKDLDFFDVNQRVGRYYIRMNVSDKPGVLADVSAILRDHNVSIEELIQRARDADKPVPVMMITHEAKYGDIAKSVALIEALESCAGKPCVMRIEDAL